MSNVPSFSEKRIDEDFNLAFDFTNRLGTGETISSAPWTATVHKGTDASPQNIVNGSATIAGAIVTQKIIDGLDGVTYCLICAATTSAGQQLHGHAHLRVNNDC